MRHLVTCICHATKPSMYVQSDEMHEAMTTYEAELTVPNKEVVSYIYNPETFAKEHKVPFFHVVDDPLELLKLVKPFEFRGRKFITFDTETHPFFPNSHVVPSTVVRRWVGTGKKAVPQDFPFCISICDGTNSYTIFDSVQNGFEKFKQLAPLFEDPSVEKIAHNTGRVNLVL